MALEEIELRLRRLEAAHSLQNPEDLSSALVCKAAAEVAKQVDAQGREYNVLEETVYGLEVAARDRESRLDTLELRINALENGNVRIGEASEEPTKTNTDAQESDTTAVISTSLHSLAKDIDSISARLQQLEARSPSPLSSFTTHEIAQDLLRRLGDGNTLQRLVHLQSHTCLSGIPVDSTFSFPLTPAITSMSKRTTTVSKTSDDEVSRKPRPGRPPKRKLSEATTGEPPLKRGPGRPPKHGRYVRKLSADSNPPGSSISSVSTTIRTAVARAQVNTTTGPKHQLRNPNMSEATKPTHGTREDREVSESPSDSVGPTSLDSDEPLQAYAERKNQCAFISTEHDDEVEVDNPASALAAFKTRKRYSDGLLTRDSPIDMETELLAEPSSENATVPEELRTNRRGAVSMDAYIEKATGEQVVIPPERRSRRTPKRTKPFGDVMSWKEANMQMQGMKPVAP